MTPIWWTAAASAAAWVVVWLSAGSTAAVDVGFGMLGPLVSAAGTARLVHRHQGDAARLHQMLLRAFIVKVLFFGVYIVVMLRVLSLNPVPFVVSFTIAFVALYAGEAARLRRTGASAA